MHHVISKDIENLLSDFDRLYILTVLYEGPTHGYEILQKFQERLKKRGAPGSSIPSSSSSKRGEWSHSKGKCAETGRGRSTPSPLKDEDSASDCSRGSRQSSPRP